MRRLSFINLVKGFQNGRNAKSPLFLAGFLLNVKPGDVLLSHGETPHYHRRYFVSLLSSAWNQVGPKRYGRQANSFSLFLENNLESCFCVLYTFNSVLALSPSKPLGCCMVKPHGQLVQVSSTPHNAYTPCLSTS